MNHDLDCEICGQPGQPSWAGTILCEACYGTIGATCSGAPRRRPSPPAASGALPPEADPPVC